MFFGMIQIFYLQPVADVQLLYIYITVVTGLLVVII